MSSELPRAILPDDRLNIVYWLGQVAAEEMMNDALCSSPDLEVPSGPSAGPDPADGCCTTASVTPDHQPFVPHLSDPEVPASIPALATSEHEAGRDETSVPHLPMVQPPQACILCESLLTPDAEVVGFYKATDPTVSLNLAHTVHPAHVACVHHLMPTAAAYRKVRNAGLKPCTFVPTPFAKFDARKPPPRRRYTMCGSCGGTDRCCWLQNGHMCLAHEMGPKDLALGLKMLAM